MPIPILATKYNIQHKEQSMIKAEIVADSVNPEGVRITTMELTYPRFVHSEVMTHRMFSRNAASSRAIPAKTLRKMVWNSPAVPIHWGQNQGGMQAKAELQGFKLKAAKVVWNLGAKLACIVNKSMEMAKVHKQICNRVLEPFQDIKTIVTATEYDNFFWLRDHEDAQPEIWELAKAMKIARDASKPESVHWGQWHLPYANGTETMSLKDRIAVSISCCAQISYRKNDTSLEKAHRIADSLTSGSRTHASPFEHQAKAQKYVNKNGHKLNGLPTGFTHKDKDDVWSGNFKNWVQNRNLM